MTFLFHSTIVGQLVGRVAISSAAFSGQELGAVTGQAEVLVTDMRTGNGARDRHLRETMQVDSFPVIHLDLMSVTPGTRSGDTVAVAVHGRLVLHGVAREVSAQGIVVLAADAVDVTLTFPVDMRDFGIKPPVRALVLRVGPDVGVTARLTFSRRTP